jgi:Protein of unknown function (DUF3052)
MPAGYSGKPLYQKLGIKSGQRICVMGAPDDYEDIIEGTVPGMTVTNDARQKVDMAHIFETRHAELARKLPVLMKAIAPDGAIWVSWPKKSSKVATDITEDVIRTVALALGLVDVKVCAVNEVWSGLKLVIRRERR